MLSAIAAVLIGFVFVVMRSVRRNRRVIAAGGEGYQPPPGVIRWDAVSKGETGSDG